MPVFFLLFFFIECAWSFPQTSLSVVLTIPTHGLYHTIAYLVHLVPSTASYLLCAVGFFLLLSHPSCKSAIWTFSKWREISQDEETPRNYKLLRGWKSAKYLFNFFPATELSETKVMFVFIDLFWKVYYCTICYMKLTVVTRLNCKLDWLACVVIGLNCVLISRASLL